MSSSDLTTQDAPRPTDLATLANEINDLHDRATEAARTAVEHARKCGERLIQAKDQIGHGGFLEWLQANCRVKPRQAQKFMKLAREWPAIDAKCASNAHLTIDGVLRLLDSGEKLTQQEPTEIAGLTTLTVQQAVAERRQPDPTLAGSPPAVGYPFDDEADPFGEGLEVGRTDADGQDDYQELPPPPPRNGTEAVGASKPPKDPFALQRSKTIKTFEAGMRALDDLQRIRKFGAHQRAIDACKKIIAAVKGLRQ